MKKFKLSNSIKTLKVFTNNSKRVTINWTISPPSKFWTFLTFSWLKFYDVYTTEYNELESKLMTCSIHVLFTFEYFQRKVVLFLKKFYFSENMEEIIRQLFIIFSWQTIQNHQFKKHILLPDQIIPILYNIPIMKK